MHERRPRCQDASGFGRTPPRPLSKQCLKSRRMRAGSHKRWSGIQGPHPARAQDQIIKVKYQVQNASGLARTPSPRPECEPGRTDATSERSNVQNASGLARTPSRELARTPPRRVRAPRMRANMHTRHLRELTESPKNPVIYLV